MGRSYIGGTPVCESARRAFSCDRSPSDLNVNGPQNDATTMSRRIPHPCRRHATDHHCGGPLDDAVRRPHTDRHVPHSCCRKSGDQDCGTPRATDRPSHMRDRRQTGRHHGALVNVGYSGSWRHDVFGTKDRGLRSFGQSNKEKQPCVLEARVITARTAPCGSSTECGVRARSCTRNRPNKKPAPASALGHIHRQSATGGLLVLGAHVCTGLAHGGDDFVQ